MIRDHKNFDEMIIGLASEEVIYGWSKGEVTKPETINYKSLKPEKDGLFDERIFGPTKNYECACGKYKKEKNKGKICERCGVELTESIVRRRRMGHIKLIEPVTHIWLLKASPSTIALTLNIKTKDLEEVVYFISYIVLKSGTVKKYLKERMVLDLGNSKSSEESRTRLIKTLSDIKKTLDVDSFAYQRAEDMIQDLKNPAVPFSMDECAQFINKYTGAEFGIGAKAINELLKNLDLEAEIKKVNLEIRSKKSQTDKKKMLRRISVLNAFLQSKTKPEWMTLTVIPVIPPEIRPIIQLDGGRFTTSELNDLYRRIIIRNERLKKVINLKAPSIIINNEKRMLQEAVDALFDNERKPRPVTGRDKRPLKSLSAVLKGKQGRFRQNLLGKRVDYSGRSVIAVGPELKMYQCGLPRDMALTLFKPFVIAKILSDAKESGTNITYKMAEKMIDNRDEKIWDTLEVVIKDRPVLLNRAPTLHRLGIQAFEPKLVKGKAIRLHPLSTPAFNADFDGDQMAVHVPISEEAVAEARYLMLGSRNILGPKDGKPIVTPTQDIILGNYYLTQEKKNEIGEGRIFATVNEAVIAYENKKVSLHAIIAIPAKNFEDKINPHHHNKLLITTIGKLIFNQIFVFDFPYLNEASANSLNSLSENHFISYSENIAEFIAKRPILNPFKKADLSNIIMKFFKQYGTQATAEMLDKMKDLGFKYSTISGVTISAGDMEVYDAKRTYFNEADKYLVKVNNFYQLGMITDKERHKLVVEKWTDVKDLIQNDLEKVLKKDMNNSISIMTDSGARSNTSNFVQLVGMRGLMNNPRGEIIELPIRSSFREGLNVAEFFISTHGARKGMADMALKTADSGYLTRRLVDVSQEIIITEEDCKTDKGFIVTETIDTKNHNTIVPLSDRIFGRFTKNAIFDESNNELIPANTLITEKLAEVIINANIKEVEIRSVLTCEAEEGICKYCYGLNLATGNVVDIGEAVGVIAAQSIGEPGTQLTMRTFHTGGVAGGSDITQGLPRIKELVDITNPKGAVAIISEIKGVVTEIEEENGIHYITVTSKKDERKYKTQYNASLRVKINDNVIAGQKLTEGAINIRQLLEIAGIKPVQDYILKEIQKVYRLQGIEIDDKYIEIIIKQMLCKMIIIDGGDTELLSGEIINIKDIKKINEPYLMQNKNPAFGYPVMFGIKKAPLESNSFLSAASFQDTTRVLTRSIIRRKVDPLKGLKENVILGNLIPAGTGIMETKDILARGEQAKKDQY